jgi:hypothetical protein
LEDAGNGIECVKKGRTKLMRISRQPSITGVIINQKQLENVEYFNYLGSEIKSYAKHAHEIKSRMTMAKAAFNRKALPTSKLRLNLRKRLITCYIWSIPLIGAETWTVRK